MWGTPKEMTESDIDDVVAGFVQGARIARDTGFEGVELHCSHGYLLAQFLSPNVSLVPSGNQGGSDELL
jgi:2,4-dienoyl-CoA reductase-like NADH-dependent reductase (Old Yellow Enzyme family)